MLLQNMANPLQLPVLLWHLAFHLYDRLWRPDAGHHILTLSIGQVFTKKDILSGSRVTGEGDACCRARAHVPKNHGAHIHGRAVGHRSGNLEFLPIVDRSFSHP